MRDHHQSSSNGETEAKGASVVNSNFGQLEGGWLHLNMAELDLNQLLVGYTNDAVLTAVQASSPDFDGLAGLPLLRMVEYGGNATSFWLRSVPSQP